jgi:hypothetical protein
MKGTYTDSNGTLDVDEFSIDEFLLNVGDFWILNHPPSKALQCSNGILKIRNFLRFGSLAKVSFLLTKGDK